MRLRIAAVQLNPVIGQLEETSKRALRLLESVPQLQTSKPDLIVLPELALTGYNFSNRAHIEPFLEIKGSGPSFNLGKQLSLKYNCHTLLGYPEKFPSDEKSFKIYNSAVLISPLGTVIHNYRKTFLYETDENFGAEESPDGFQAFDIDIKGQKVRTSIGICMDLNPYKFKAPFTEYEFANFCHRENVQLVLVPTAWMNSNWSDNWTAADAQSFGELYEKELPFDINTDPALNEVILDPSESKFDRQLPDKSTARYWILRFNPLYTNEHPDHRKLVVVCNRSGVEGKLMYGGSSSIFRFNGGKAMATENGMSIDFDVFGTLGQGTEGVLLRDVEI